MYCLFHVTSPWDGLTYEAWTEGTGPTFALDFRVSDKKIWKDTHNTRLKTWVNHTTQQEQKWVLMLPSHHQAKRQCSDCLFSSIVGSRSYLFSSFSHNWTPITGTKWIHTSNHSRSYHPSLVRQRTQHGYSGDQLSWSLLIWSYFKPSWISRTFLYVKVFRDPSTVVPKHPPSPSLMKGVIEHLYEKSRARCSLCATSFRPSSYHPMGSWKVWCSNMVNGVLDPDYLGAYQT